MMLEIAIGDAYGAGFEYEAEYLSRNDLSRYIKHPRHAVPPGWYTDDTQMSIAIAEAIAEDDPWTEVSLAARFVRVFRRDRREGYASGFASVLRVVETGPELIAAIHGQSDKSGAAMRSVPIGLFSDLPEVKSRAGVNARITHDSPGGVASSEAAALAAHYLLCDLGPRSELGQFLERHVPGYDWANPWSGKVKSKGWMSARAAITTVGASRSQSEILRRSVAFGGDTDTAASIALGLASCAQDAIGDLP